MKKIIVFISIFLISFSSLWAVWEGNAAAGISADFPSDGMFVRSDMFPKHTLVEIINLEKDIKVRAVVIGTAGIPGLLASLSPKVANELKIDSKKTARIRIFIPTHVRELGEDESDLSLPEYAQDNTLSVEIVKKMTLIPNLFFMMNLKFLFLKNRQKFWQQNRSRKLKKLLSL
ncbi:hypothetical protein [Treponema phagedenis]|uniref:hypothetical protein n=1 Tax=Treponema phagedenis TaxID=162 RepID=UPI0011ED1A29|nr:hypothetical protein [Treponema phagedenis]TYT78701.1 hypothetical protein FS559_05995 [Treponema phagedenis]